MVFSENHIEYVSNACYTRSGLYTSGDGNLGGKIGSNAVAQSTLCSTRASVALMANVHSL